MRDWKNNPPTGDEMDRATAYHEALMVVARERWPEMVDEPTIIPFGPGIESVQMPYVEMEPLKWFEPDDPEWMTQEKLERMWDGRPPEGFRVSHVLIELGQVGPYRLEYSTRFESLFIGQ